MTVGVVEGHGWWVADSLSRSGITGLLDRMDRNGLISPTASAAGRRGSTSRSP